MLLLDAEDAAGQKEEDENSGSATERGDDVHLCVSNHDVFSKKLDRFANFQFQVLHLSTLIAGLFFNII